MSAQQTVGEAADKAGEVGQNAVETGKKAAGDVAEQTGLKGEE